MELFFYINLSLRSKNRPFNKYTMKKSIIILSILISGISSSQVIIGDAVGTAPANNKTSVLLEFAATQNKGIILPYVRTLPANPAEGTILLDASTPTAARIKYYNANTTPGSNGWKDLSGQDSDVTASLAGQPNIAEAANAKAIIGSDYSPADGVLVLESTSKAMILPTVTDVNNIPSPSPGMMVYVNKAGAKRLAVFNGAKWSFWKP